MNQKRPVEAIECLARTSAVSFTPLRTIAPGPLFRNRPNSEEPYCRYIDRDGFDCFVSFKCILRMAAWGRAAGENEVIGRLGGRLCTDSRGIYVIIEDASLNHTAVGTPGSVVADGTSQEHGRIEFEKRCRPFDLNGWWHTHPGNIGLFFSGPDRRNQATWTDANSIGIVVNPDLRGDVIKVFRGPQCSELKPVDPDALRKLRQHTHDPVRGSGHSGSRNCGRCQSIAAGRIEPCELQVSREHGWIRTIAAMPFSAAVAPMVLIILLVQAMFLGARMGRVTSVEPIVKVVLPAVPAAIPSQTIEPPKAAPPTTEDVASRVVRKTAPTKKSTGAVAITATTKPAAVAKKTTSSKPASGPAQ